MEVKANFGKLPESWKLPKFREPGLDECRTPFQGKVLNLRNFIPMWSKQTCKLWLPLLSISFLLEGLVSGLGLLALGDLGGGGLDDTHSNGLPHVTDSEPSKGWELGEGLNTHGLAGGEDDDGSVTRLDELGVVFCGFTCTTVNLLLDLSELASNVGGVTIQDWRVSVGDLSRVVQDDDLSGEVSDTSCWLVLGVRGDIPSLDVLHCDVLDVEPNVVSRGSLGERLVVHLHGLDLSGQLVRGEGDDHAGLDDTSLDTAHWNCSNASNFVNILKGKSEGLVGRSGGGNDGVKSLKEGGAAGLAFLALNSPSLVPGHVRAGLQHVVAVPSGDGDEGDSHGVVADLLDEARDFLLDLLKPSLAVWGLGGVHLVDSDDELLDSQGVSQEGVLSSLAVLGDASFELTGAGGDDKDTAISLRGSSDHVLDEIPVSGGVDDGDIVPGGLELPESDIDGDSSLTLSLQFVKNPCVLERSLARLLGLLLELFDGPLVDATALVDQVTGGGGLAGVDVANNNNVNVDLFLSHYRSRITTNSLVEVNQANISLV